MNPRQIYRERLRRNPKFRAARQEFIKAFPDYPHGVWTEELVKNLDKFVTEWGVAPIDPDSTDFDKDPLYYYQQVGKDGAFLIRVFPWTTEEEIIQEFKTIRRTFQPQQEMSADQETMKRIIDLVNRGEDFRSIGRKVFGPTLDRKAQEELEIDARFDQLMKVLVADGAGAEEAAQKALRRLKSEDAYAALKRPYEPGERTRSLEKRARKLYELLKPGLE